MTKAQSQGECVIRQVRLSIAHALEDHTKVTGRATLLIVAPWQKFKVQHVAFALSPPVVRVYTHYDENGVPAAHFDFDDAEHAARYITACLQDPAARTKRTACPCS